MTFALTIFDLVSYCPEVVSLFQFIQGFAQSSYSLFYLTLLCQYTYVLLLDVMEKAMAPHSSTLAWKIPWMEEPGRLQSMGLQRVGHD